MPYLFVPNVNCYTYSSADVNETGRTLCLRTVTASPARNQSIDVPFHKSFLLHLQVTDDPRSMQPVFHNSSSAILHSHFKLFDRKGNLYIWISLNKLKIIPQTEFEERKERPEVGMY